MHDEILGRLRVLPSVEAAGAASDFVLPLSPASSTRRTVNVAGGATRDVEDVQSALWGFATPGYFQAMGIPLLQGRTFRTGDWAREAPAVVLSESLARAFPRQNPVGQRIRLDGRSHTVVGVVGGVPSGMIREGPSKVMYFPNIYPALADTIVGEKFFYIPIDAAYTIRTSVPPASLVPAVRRIIEQVDPALHMSNVTTMEQLVADSMARTRLFMLLLLVGAGTALLLGVIGIYGVLAYSVRQRTSELGIRLALGASPGNMIRMVVRQGALIALAGIALGLGAAYALTRFLGSLLYQVSPTDPWAYAVAAVLLFVVALVASYLPARRAGRIDPARALQSE